MKKKFMHAEKPKKYSRIGLKGNVNEKIHAALKFPTPHNFRNGPSLTTEVFEIFVGSITSSCLGNEPALLPRKSLLGIEPERAAKTEA